MPPLLARARRTSTDCSTRVLLLPHRWAIARFHSSVCGGLDVVELGVLAIPGNQFLMCSKLHEPRAVEHDDEIGHPYGREAMGDKNGDASAAAFAAVFAAYGRRVALE